MVGSSTERIFPGDVTRRIAFSVALTLACASLATVLAQDSWESGFKGTLEIGQSVSAVSGSAEEEFVNYHTYAVYVPEGMTELVIRLDTVGDLDLAWKAGSTILDYDDDPDFVDLSDAHGGTYRIDNPRSGPLFIDVVNYYGQGFGYDLEVTGTGGEATALVNGWPEVVPLGGRWPEGAPFATMGRLEDGSQVSGHLRETEDLTGLAWHAWLFSVPEGAAGFTVTLESPESLSLALRHGAEITNYAAPEDGGDWDYFVWGQEGVPLLVFDVPVSGPGDWYLDLVNDGGYPGVRYNLTAATY